MVIIRERGDMAIVRERRDMALLMKGGTWLY